MVESFERYYEREWLGMDSYFFVHRRRFISSWGAISGISWKGARVLDVGGVGPLAAFARDCFGAAAFESKDDLRGHVQFNNDEFDVILCTETIEHIKDIDSPDIVDLEAFNYSGVANMLREFVRIGKNGCKVFVTTPNASSFITLHKWLNRELLLMDPKHVREFTIRDLALQCEGAGLTTLWIQAADTWEEHFGEAVQKAQTLLRGAGYDMRDRGDNIFGLFEVRK
jgi:hypothetical protein